MLLTLTFGKETFKLDSSNTETVCDLKAQIEALTDIWPVRQKLICRGKVLQDSQGQTAAAAVLSEKAAEAATRKERFRRQRQGQAFLLSQQHSASEEEAKRVQNWGRTGLAVLRGEETDSLPAGLWQVAEQLQSLDCRGTRLAGLPQQSDRLQRLQRLRISHNFTEPSGLDQLGHLTRLEVLILDTSRLTSLPEALCKLRCLHTLDASGNSLTALPDSIGCMSALRNLQVHHNSITALPDCLASCSRLEHLDACANRLTQLPETLALLQQLSTLILDDNRIKELPTSLLQHCASLWQISLHRNPISLEALRSSPGFDAYDARRRVRSDKQIDMRVIEPGFDEGADEVRWSRFMK